jgi:hypothetical protein
MQIQAEEMCTAHRRRPAAFWRDPACPPQPRRGEGVVPATKIKIPNQKFGIFVYPLFPRFIINDIKVTIPNASMYC